MLLFFLYSRDVAFVLSFYQATILSNVAFGVFFRSIRATVLDNTRITFGVFSSLYRDKRAFLLILLFGVFFLFEGSLYFSFIFFEGGGVCFGGLGVVSFLCLFVFFLFLLLVLLFRFNIREIFL